MTGPTVEPSCVKRQPFYWMRLRNLIAARRVLRVDGSNRWRHAFGAGAPAGRSPADSSRPFSYLLDRQPVTAGFRFLILADTGEGDWSQMGTLPLIRALRPDFLLINGDIAYPAGRDEDFEDGFFRPYRGLDCPVWVVPGNHEYYSRDKGRELWDIFCTRSRALSWDRAGLRLRPQPGTFWELGESGIPLVVLGFDTGLKGRIDGTFRMRRDAIQLEWLDRRLRRADRAGLAAIVLFHIPGLAKQRNAQKKGLGSLHRILASHPSVRLVVTGHWHNLQRYTPARFAQFLEREHGCRPAAEPPEYIVCGGGGAFLHGTTFKSSQYPVASRYPTQAQWREYAGSAQKAVGQLNLDKSLIGGIVAAADKVTRADADQARFLSFLQVDVPPANSGRPTVTPVTLDDVADLFPSAPPGALIDPSDPTVQAEPAAAAACLRINEKIVL